ncbi:hypothetical protein [Dictyobacter formicarum]|uniref:Core-binding (CB) domain-containing protein n=1 Tax=Dictyobacter formicarum TaxID=2778368 RepID=A0ABQ3V9Z9_9CHLR|nr:hypothetical protein [Dictyobacter formicarum]GHO82702.1 hypothetical protein KSZ_07080 [Dictyobacter formicarum]
MGQWFQQLLANAKYGSVNDATIQGYLRAASQIESVWQQIDDKADELILQGLPPGRRIPGWPMLWRLSAPAV